MKVADEPAHTGREKQDGGASRVSERESGEAEAGKRPTGEQIRNPNTCVRPGIALPRRRDTESPRAGRECGDCQPTTVRRRVHGEQRRRARSWPGSRPLAKSELSGAALHALVA